MLRLGTSSINALAPDATPGIDFSDRNGQSMLTLHLSKNKQPIIHNDPNNPRTPVSTAAIKISGTVEVQVDDPRDFADWDFSFIQLFRLIDLTAQYAGASPTDGHLEFYFANPP